MLSAWLSHSCQPAARGYDAATFTWWHEAQIAEVVGDRRPVAHRQVGDVLYKRYAALWRNLGHHAKVQDSDLAVWRAQLPKSMIVSTGRACGERQPQGVSALKGSAVQHMHVCWCEGQAAGWGRAAPGSRDAGQNARTCTCRGALRGTRLESPAPGSALPSAIGAASARAHPDSRSWMR